MEYVYGAMLLHSAGKEITEDTLKGVLEAAGIAVDDSKLKALTASLEDVNIEEILEKAAAAPVVTASAPSTASPTEEKTEDKKEEEEEEKEEVSEEEVAEGLGALFG